MKKVYGSILVVIFLFSYTACKPSEQIITVSNKSGKDLSNVMIKSSRFQKHAHKRWRKILKGGSAYTPSIKKDEEIDLLFSGNLNSQCLTISSDSLNLLIYDCMEEEIIKSKVKILIMPRSMEINRSH